MVFCVLRHIRNCWFIIIINKFTETVTVLTTLIRHIVPYTYIYHFTIQYYGYLVPSGIRFAGSGCFTILNYSLSVNLFWLNPPIFYNFCCCQTGFYLSKNGGILTILTSTSFAAYKSRGAGTWGMTLLTIVAESDCGNSKHVSSDSTIRKRAIDAPATFARFKLSGGNSMMRCQVEVWQSQYSLGKL